MTDAQNKTTTSQTDRSERRGPNQAPPVRLPRKTAQAYLILAAIIGFPVWFLVIRNPVPADAELIAHFQAHRADFETLIERYRAADRTSASAKPVWYDDGKTPEVLRRAGIWSVACMGRGHPWLPEPYAQATGRYIEASREKLPPLTLRHKYCALLFNLSDQRYHKPSLRHVRVTKGLIFFPEVPRIENGRLLFPVDGQGQYSASSRVVESLDGFPDEWKSFECVLRQIEPQWFIDMCKGR